MHSVICLKIDAEKTRYIYSRNFAEYILCYIFKSILLIVLNVHKAAEMVQSRNSLKTHSVHITVIPTVNHTFYDENAENWIEYVGQTSTSTYREKLHSHFADKWNWPLSGICRLL